MSQEARVVTDQRHQPGWRAAYC